jgi:hypothetical protein
MVRTPESLHARGACSVLAAALLSACVTTHPRLAPPADEPPIRLRVGDRVEGKLDETSRRSLKDGSPHAVFELSGKAGTAVEIRAHSDELDTFLSLFSPDGRIIALNEQANHQSTDARIQTLLPDSGTYLVVVSGVGPDDLGAYRLEIDPLEFRSGGPVDVPASLTGLLHAGDEAMIARNTFVDRFVVRVDEPKTVVIDMTSDSVDAYLFVTDSRGGVILGENDDAFPGTTDARVVVDLQPGSYQILATTFHPESQGLYELSVRTLELVHGGDLPLPGEVTGRLRNIDPVRAPRSSHYHAFTLEVPEPQTLIIDMASTEVDAFLYLYDGDGETQLAENDDRPGGGTDARIIHEVEAGTYRVVASTYRAHETGIYDLTARSVTLTDDNRLAIPSAAMGLLGGRESQARGTRNALQDRYVLEVTEATTLRVDMRSDSFDAYLILLASDGSTVLAENDDASPYTTDAQLLMHLTPGRYFVAATSFHPGEEGLYEIEVAEIPGDTPGVMRVGAP